MSKKIWLVSVNWDKLKETGLLYEWAHYESFYEGEDTSHNMVKIAEKGEQIYLFTTKKHADNLRSQIEKVAIENLGAEREGSMSKLYNIIDEQLGSTYEERITLEQARGTAIRIMERSIEEDEPQYKQENERYIRQLKEAKTAEKIGEWLSWFDYKLEEA